MLADARQPEALHDVEVHVLHRARAVEGAHRRLPQLDELVLLVRIDGFLLKRSRYTLSGNTKSAKRDVSPISTSNDTSRLILSCRPARRPVAARRAWSPPANGDG